MTIGERIRTLRMAEGLTQEDLGRLCGTTKQTIYKYECGIVTNIPSDRLDRLAEALHSTPAVLMGWEDAPPECEYVRAKIAALIRKVPDEDLDRLLAILRAMYPDATNG